MIAASRGEQENQFNQLDIPTSLFANDQEAVYTSDTYNHRVMKWNKN